MRLVYLTHSLESCWNHGNAHFLRGVLRALVAAGHDVAAVEPEEAWSRANLVADAGRGCAGRGGARTTPACPAGAFRRRPGDAGWTGRTW